MIASCIYNCNADSSRCIIFTARLVIQLSNNTLALVHLGKIVSA